MPDAKLYSNKDWRAMLEVVDGRGSAQKRQMRMKDHLQALMRDTTSSGISLDMERIDTIPAFWNGIEVKVNSFGQVDVGIVREIVWELYEAKFRLEMFLLERKMMPEPMGEGDHWEMARDIWYERERLVHRCWPGQAHRPQTSRPGFSKIGDNSSRLPFIRALFGLVQAWPGPKPAELCNPFPAEEDQLALREVEEIMASYYIRTFLKCFQRPPTIPHVVVPVGPVAASSR